MERNDNFGSAGGMGENTGSSGSSGFGGSGSLGNSGGLTGSAGYGSGSSAAGTPSTGYGDAGATGGSSSFGATGGAAGSYGSTGGAGSTGATSGGVGEKLSDAREAATEKLGNAREAAGSKLGALKEKAAGLSATLADKLEAGAEKLRAQQGGAGGSMAFAGGTTDGNTQGMGAMGNQLAGGLQGAADWLREGDLKATVEQQVREHPGRTLLIALAAGYVLGKAFRK